MLTGRFNKTAGYKYFFPFLRESEHLRLESERNRLYPAGLYKGVVWARQPSLFYVGMQDPHFSFPMFDAQAFFIAALLSGQVECASQGEMQEDIAVWRAREEQVGTDLEAGMQFQADYMADLRKAVGNTTNYDVLTPRKEYNRDRLESLVHYRDKAFRSVITGTMSRVDPPWWEAYDDSLDTYKRLE